MCYVTALPLSLSLSRTPVNSISKSTSALLSGYLLLEIPVNLYKWRAVMQLHSYPGLQVSFSFDPTAFLARTQDEEASRRQRREKNEGRQGAAAGRGRGTFVESVEHR